MAYQIIASDQCDHCMDYVKEVSDGRCWECVGCGLKEGTLYLGKREGVFLWSRYELPCGHQCHERCYRRWCHQEDGVGCPTCGPVKREQAEGYCRYCRSWGHVRKACPLLSLLSYSQRGERERRREREWESERENALQCK